VHQLLNQTSGIPQPLTTQLATSQDDQALERNVRSLAGIELIGPPGRAFTYSNGNWATLGMIIQAVSGQSYEEYIEQHIYAPLDMQNSFTSQEEARQNGMATGHRWWFGFPIPVTLPYNRTELPGGYLISSAEDMGHFLIAQLNGGRYDNRSVLSPDGMALIHEEALHNPYGLGWESEQLNGRPVIYHIGGVPNFQSSLFFDPEARVGVFIAANVCIALDAFSSPAGVTGMDGVTTRAMAQSVLSMVMNEPMPEPGLGNGRLYLIFNFILLALTTVIVISLARIPVWYQQLTQQGIVTGFILARHTVLIIILYFAWPVFVLYLNLRVTAWKVYAMMYQPDFGYWLNIVAAVVSFAGLVKIALVLRAFWQSSQTGLLP
jgi:CubicO group peptidase (beta-lactamase class C family)